MYSYTNFIYLIKILSRFYSKFKLIYIKLVKHILCYVFNIFQFSLILNNKINTLDDIIRYIDFNFVRLKFNQKSIRNYIFILAKTIISHFFKL